MQLSRSTAAFIVCLTLSLFLCSTSTASPTTNDDQTPPAEKPDPSEESGKGEEVVSTAQPEANPDPLGTNPTASGDGLSFEDWM
ncbi:hypothetical protein IWQ61_010318 [Dispira simplex]|nr:hypothetical protein IWQ61_010318 [Dispira simplex]